MIISFSKNQVETLTFPLAAFEMSSLHCQSCVLLLLVDVLTVSAGVNLFNKVLEKMLNQKYLLDKIGHSVMHYK